MNFPSNLLQIATHLATIGPRSWSWPSVDRRHLVVEAFPPRSLSDRTAIAVRSDRDRGVLPRSVWTVRLIFRWVNGPIVILRNPLLKKIQRFSCRHAALGKSSDLIHLLPIFNTFLIWRSRGLGSTRSTPCDQSRPDLTPVVPPRILQGKNRVGT